MIVHNFHGAELSTFKPGKSEQETGEKKRVFFGVVAAVVMVNCCENEKKRK
jgi:hypothetical protein